MVKLITLSKGKERNVNTIEATFSVEGQLLPLRVNEDDRPDVFNKIKNLLENQTPGSNIEDTASELFSLMSPQALVTQQINSSYYLSESMSIKDGKIFFGKFKLEDTLANHMLSLLNEENTPKDEKMWKSYVKFLDNLHQNADEDIRLQLFRWMEYENKAGNGFGITDDGCLVGYKGCDGTIIEPMSVHSGKAIVDGEEYNGKIPNKVGSVIQMPRSTVQFDPSVGCSQGLHVGTRDYATKWAPILLLVKVNPRDVVSVPYECESQKMRVCEYTVLKVTDATDEHKMYYSVDTDYDENENVLTLGDAYNLLGENVYIEFETSSGSASTTGKLVDVYEDGNASVVVEDKEGSRYDIDLDEITYFSIEDENSKDEEDFELTLEDAYLLLEEGTEIEVIYEGKDNTGPVVHTGVVVEVYESIGKDPGVIVKSSENEYKHVKLFRIEGWNKVNLYEQTINKDFENLVDNDCKVCGEPTNDFCGASSCPNEPNVELYKDIYEAKLGSLVAVVVTDKKTQAVKMVAGELISVSKEDMNFTVKNLYTSTLIDFIDVVSFKLM